MEAALPWLVFAGGGVVLLYLLGKQLIAEWYKQKREFVDELVQKQKDGEYGKDRAPL